MWNDVRVHGTYICFPPPLFASYCDPFQDRVAYTILVSLVWTTMLQKFWDITFIEHSLQNCYRFCSIRPIRGIPVHTPLIRDKFTQFLVQVTDRSLLIRFNTFIISCGTDWQIFNWQLLTDETLSNVEDTSLPQEDLDEGNNNFRANEMNKAEGNEC